MSEYDKTNYKTILDDVLSVFENQIKDTSIDYTPITPDKSGTINDYLKRLQKQSQEVSQSEFSTIQSQEQLNKAVSFVRNKKWRNTMEEKTMTNKVTVGEVVIVRRPHTQQVKLYWYGDVDEAFDAWKNEGTFMQYENAENYINELGIESGEESEEVKKRLVDAGINLDSPFVEFAPSPSRDMELYPWDGNKVKFLSAIIEDDMHAAGIFIAQDGETYDDFVERIIEGSRGHNEPSKTSIMATLGIDPEDIEMEIYANKDIHTRNSGGYEAWSEYDEKGNEIHRRDSSGKEEWREYNEKGNEVHFKNSSGYEEWKEHDANGNVIHQRDSDGKEEWSEYDEKGNKVHFKNSSGYEEWKEHDANGNVIHYKDTDGYEEWSEYDEKGNEIHQRDSSGYEEWREYDANGNVIHQRDSDGYEAWSEYDEKGNEIHQRDSSGYEEWIWYKYDEKGNEVRRKTSDGFEEWREYDANGNQIHWKISNGYEDQQYHQQPMDNTPQKSMEQTEKEPYEKLDRDFENLSREEAVALLGERLISDVESLHCDYTNRVTDGTEWQGFTEFMSSLELGNNNYHINAYYYQKNEDVEKTEDLGSLKWEVEKFEIIPWDLSAGEALSLQGFTDMVIDYGDEGTQVAGWKDLTEQQQEILALAYYQFRQEEERDIEVEDYHASSYAAIESYYQEFIEAGFNRDVTIKQNPAIANVQSEISSEEWSLTVKDYNACCFADSKEVSFLSFKYSCDEKAVRSTLNIQPSVVDIRSPGKLELEYRLDHLGKEEFLATDSLSQNFITYKDCEYATPNKYNFPKEFKESLRNVAQKYTQTQFGKSIKEQFIAENERTKIPKQTIQGEKNMEQTEKKTPYYQQQIEKLHEAVKTGTAPFFLKEAVVDENNEVKNPGNYIEDNDKIILTPRPAVRTVKGNLLKGVNQLSAQIELDNMGSKAQTVLSFEDAKAAGTYIKKGSKSILLTGYDKDNERSKVYHVFSAGSVANKDVIKEQLYKNNELNKEKPWSKAIVCTDSNPEKYLGAYLAASASGSVLETDRKTVEDFQKNFETFIAKSVNEKKHTAVFDTVRSAQILKSEILKENYSAWEKSQGQQQGQQKKPRQSDMEMVF